MNQSSKHPRRDVLDAAKRQKILALVANGSSRRTAARYVGCEPSTIGRTAMRDPEPPRPSDEFRDSAPDDELPADDEPPACVEPPECPPEDAPPYTSSGGNMAGSCNTPATVLHELRRGRSTQLATSKSVTPMRRGSTFSVLRDLLRVACCTRGPRGGRRTFRHRALPTEPWLRRAGRQRKRPQIV